MPLLLDVPAVATPDLGVVRVTGADRLTYLHTLLSQHLEAATPGTAADFLYLDAKGNPQASGRALVGEQDVILITPTPAVAAALASALQTYRFLMQVEAADESARHVLVSARGPAWVALAGAPSEPMTSVAHGAGVVVRDRSGGVDLLGPPAWTRAQLAAGGLPVASAAEWEAWRIGAGEPAWGSEISAGRRAQELGLLPTHVHLRKGCYPGQESIAKIYNLGRPRRALAVVAFDGPVAPGNGVELGGKRGEVTSAAARGPGWVALALLPVDRRGRPLDGPVTVGSATGTVLRLVGEGLPQPGAQPARA
jgi:hypothetical protein